VTALVEWPVPLVCSFEERFLDVPQEALITTMQDNQKYFCLLDSATASCCRVSLPWPTSKPRPAADHRQVTKVVRPRLTDAEFFFKQDKKQKLEDFNLRLQNVVFQAQLGTVYDKAERVSKLAAFIAPLIGGDAACARAGLLSKCDRPPRWSANSRKCKGCRLLLRAQRWRAGRRRPGTEQAVHAARCRRRAAADLTGAAVAIADKLDTLVGIFGIGMLPTGSKDPYALRRAASGRAAYPDRQTRPRPGRRHVLRGEAFGARVKAAGLAERC
jgi:glycyl-tRNA synthetase beta chain